MRDVSSSYCRQRKHVSLEQLDQYDKEEGCWLDIVVEDKHAGPAEVAAIRIDFSAWLQFLPRRLRKIAKFLANGETTGAAAKRFRISQGRISQIRRQLYEAWLSFQGEDPALAMARAKAG